MAWTRMDYASSARAAEDKARWQGLVVKSSVLPGHRKIMGYTRLD